jgi:SAM-dependent methyltransferase
MNDATASPKLGHGLEFTDEGGNYYEWLADTFATYLRKASGAPGARNRIVEHGAGTGAISQLLLDRHVGHMVLTEPDDTLVDILRPRFAGRSDAEIVHGTLEQYLERMGPGSVDAVVSSNVLEHVVDDEACLSAMWSLLRPGGTLALYVPARPELYSDFDRAVGHQRRYRRSDLRAKLERAQFETRMLAYRNFVGALGWLALGRFLKNPGVGKSSVWVHDRIVFPVSRFVEDKFAPPYGSNLLCIAEKPRQQAAHDKAG